MVKINILSLTENTNMIALTQGGLLFWSLNPVIGDMISTVIFFIFNGVIVCLRNRWKERLSVSDAVISQKRKFEDVLWSCEMSDFIEDNES